MVSRVAKAPIALPKGVEAKISGQDIIIKGKLGENHYSIHPLVRVQLAENMLQLTPTDDSTDANKIAGTMRALTQNMVIGVSAGFEEKLVLVGVGYRAKVEGNGRRVNLSVGFSHPVEIALPDGVTAETPSQTEITLKGIDKKKVSQAAADIRSVRKPEVYKGKGVRYKDERINLKEVKKK